MERSNIDWKGREKRTIESSSSVYKLDKSHKRKHSRHSSSSSTSPVRKNVKKRKKERKTSTSSSYSTSSDDERQQRKKKKKSHKKEKYQKKKHKKKKKKGKERFEKSNVPRKAVVVSAVKTESLNELTINKKKPMVPMTKEQYERQQSIVKRVYDPDTGRNRLIKGDGEVLEEIVSYAKHKQINKLSTKMDGESFAASIGLSRR